MSPVTLSQLRTWDPAALDAPARAWDALTARLTAYFDTYVHDLARLADGGYWEGSTADAAGAAARADRTTIQHIADELAALTRRIRAGYHEIDAPLRRARGYLAQAREQGFQVTEQLHITDPSRDPRSAAAVRALQSDLDSAVAATVDADHTLAHHINAARDHLRPVFAAPAALGAERGRHDGARLASGPTTLTPEECLRLVAATRLTAAQADALRAGQPVPIPAAQMEYLNALARSLDTTSPRQLRDMLDSLPPDAAQALPDALQLISNPNLTSAAAGTAELPARGGLTLLPKQIRQSITRPDLVTATTRALSYNPLDDPLSVGIHTHVIRLDAVADNHAVAAVAGRADPRYRAGSDLDRALLQVGAQYLRGQVTAEHGSHANIGGTTMTVDGGTWSHDPSAPFFAAVGDDKTAVLALVAGPGGTQFLHDACTHRWDDGGGAVATVFRFGDHDAVVTDPGDPAQVATAGRQGRIMNAVGEFAASSQTWHDLSTIDGRTAGRINPDLIRELSKSLTPYLNTLTGGAPTPGTLGFDTDPANPAWYNPDGHHGAFTGARNVFALMDTDDDAGEIFNATAYDDLAANETDVARAPFGSTDATRHLDNIGRLAGLVDAGSRQAISAHDTNAHDIAVRAYKQESSAFDADKELVTGSIPLGNGEEFTLPYKEQAAMLLGVADGLEEAVIGHDPSDDSPEDPGYEGLDLDRIQYDVVSRAPGAHRYALTHHLLGGDGQFVPWDAVRRDGDRQAGIETYFDNMTGNTNNQIDRQYQAVTTPERQSEKHDRPPR